jgi:hypothetical protein
MKAGSADPRSLDTVLIPELMNLGQKIHEYEI